jgi:hypothetical protein
MKYFIRLTVLSLIVVFGFANAAQAAQYYVDSTSTATTANGSLTTPWKTLSQVGSATLQPGDIVSFKRGTTYSGTLTVNRSGTAGNPITFNTYGTGAAPAFIGTGSTIEALVTIPSGRSYITFDGITITDPTLSPTDRSQDAKIRRAYVIYGSANNIVIRNCVMTLVGVGLYAEGPNNTVERCEIGNTRMVVDDNDGGVDDYGANPVVISSANNKILYNNFYDNWATSYDFGYDGGAVELYGSGVNNNIIAYNIMSNNNGLMEIGSNGSGGANNNIIAYNKFINNEGLVSMHNSGTFNTSISNIQFYNNVIVENVAGRLGSSRMIWSAATMSPGMVIMKNNIFQLSTGIDVSSNWNGITHTHNIYKLSNGSTVASGLDSTEKTTSGTLFASTAGNAVDWDYRPVSNSIAINAGTGVGQTSDFAGTIVPQDGVVDIGAYEQVGGTTPTPDTTAPSVTMTAPTGGATVSGTTTLSATASDNIAVVGVQFKLNGANAGSEDTSAPYTMAWNTTTVVNGTYTLSATARDAAGNTNTSSITVTVNNTVTPPADTTAPTVAFTSPAAGATVVGTVAITADAADNVGVASVAFSLDGILHTTDTTAPYSATFISDGVANGAHTWTAVARDAAGNSATATRSITVNNTVTPPAPTTPTGLTAVATSPTTVVLSWNSSGTVYGYELWRNGSNIGHTTGQGTTYTDTGLTANTTYSYAVSAIYPCDCNETGQSAPASVTTPTITTPPTAPMMIITGTRVNVRSNPTTWIGGTILGQQLKNAVGTIIGGPVTANGYTWWKLDFPTAPDGWVVGQYLREYTGSTTARAAVSTTTTTTPTTVSSLEALELLQQASRATTTAEALRLIDQAQKLAR